MSLESEVTKALNQAFHLGKLYWQRADSDCASEWKRADAVTADFNKLVRETQALFASAEKGE
jgi:hypothetical protein